MAPIYREEFGPFERHLRKHIEARIFEGHDWEVFALGYLHGRCLMLKIGFPSHLVQDAANVGGFGSFEDFANRVRSFEGVQ